MALRKQVALRLRLQGKSYSEIQETLEGISKSTLSLWLRGVVLPDEVRQRIEARAFIKSREGLLRHNRLQTDQAQRRAREIKQKASETIGKLTSEQLLFLGVALYWAEGYKRPIVRSGRTLTSHSVSLTNSDPLLINCFLEFLKICEVSQDKIKMNLRIFEHMNHSQTLDFWVEATKLPKEHFSVTYVGRSKSSLGKRPHNRLPYGVAQIRINDTQLFHRIIGWIEGVKRQLPR